MSRIRNNIDDQNKLVYYRYIYDTEKKTPKKIGTNRERERERERQHTTIITTKDDNMKLT